MTTQSINVNASGFPLDSSGHNGYRTTGIDHVGLHAKDPSASAEFYRDLLSMQIVGGSGPEHPLGASAFLCSRPDEKSHDIVLFANPDLAHVAFKAPSLAAFRSLHTRVIDRGISIKFAFNHGVSFAFYFEDPDGHLVEVCWPTGAPPQSYRQPYAEPLDLTQPDDLLLEKVAHGAGVGIQENVQIVKDSYAAFGRGDIQGLLALFAEDIEWIAPGEGLPRAGTYRGQAAVADLLQKLSETVEFSSFEPREFVAEGDRVLVAGFESGRLKATNRTFEGHWVMAFTVRKGRVTNVQEYNDTLALARAFEMAPDPVGA